MPAEVVIAFLVVLSAIAHFAWTQRLKMRQAKAHDEILRSGTEVQGKIVAISRPMLTGGAAEVYFTFEAAGGTRVQRCEIDMKALRERHSAFIPSVGTKVPVRYLARDPSQALIPQLAKFTEATTASHGAPQVSG